MKDDKNDFIDIQYVQTKLIKIFIDLTVKVLYVYFKCLLYLQVG